MSQIIEDLSCIVLPVLNERSNLEVLIPELSDFKIYVVDDGSDDGTQDLCNKWDNVTLIERGSKKGLVSAVLDGIARADGQFEFIVVLDADLSHNPKYVRPMLEMALSQRADLVIGSRYVKGGQSNDSLKRRLISLGANSLFKASFSRKVKDATSGFRVYSRKASTYLVDSNLSDPISNSYAGQIDILRRMVKGNFRIREYPIVFTPRKVGYSKLKSSDIKDFAILAASKGHVKRYAGVALAGLFMNQTILSVLMRGFVVHPTASILELGLLFGLSVSERWLSPESIRRRGKLMHIFYNRYGGPISIAILTNLTIFVMLVKSGITFPIADAISILCALCVIYSFMP